MNYAIVSPDSTILAAVGDENRAYFYRISRDLDAVSSTESRHKFSSWEWSLLRCIKMDTGPHPDDKCCFTIAFSPSDHLCAIAAQSGNITVFDVNAIRAGPKGGLENNAAISVFRSSRFGFEEGAVRCMSFSPRPWDLLVWVEDQGRVGVADIRQEFLRRQILELDFCDPNVQKVNMESEQDSSQNFEIRNLDEPPPDPDPMQRSILDAVENYSDDPISDTTGRSSLRDSMMQHLTERETIFEFLRTTRNSSRAGAEDALTRSTRSSTLGREPSNLVRSRPQSFADSHPYFIPPHNRSQDFPEGLTSTDSPFSRPADLEAGESSSSANDMALDPAPPRPAGTGRRLPWLSEGYERTRSTMSAIEALNRQIVSAARRGADLDSSPDNPMPYHPGESSRLRRHMAIEGINHPSQYERRYRYPAMARARIIRPSSLGFLQGSDESAGTAGVGWGADGRSL